MKRTLYFISALFFLNSCTNFHIKHGDHDHTNLKYSEAVFHYKRAAKHPGAVKDSTFYNRMGHSYSRMNDYRKADSAYTFAKKNGVMDLESHVDYARVLMAQENYNRAIAILNNYLSQRPNDERAKNMLLASKGNLDKSVPYNYAVWPVTDLNQYKYSNFSPSYYGKNKLFFASERNRRGNQENEWTGRPYLDIYTADIDSTGKASNIKAFKREINSLYHDGPVAMGADTNYLIITRTKYDAKNTRLKKTPDDKNNFTLLETTYIPAEKKWTEPKELTFVQDGASYGHPSLSEDGKTLYFSSDMVGGMGNSDLYKSVKNSEGWSKPINLGNTINTEGNESFPSLVKEEGKLNLYFSSNGHKGEGDLDIYSVEVSGDTYTNFRRFEEPINSPKDDFGLIMRKDGKTGFFSTNRFSEDNSIDKIYGFDKVDTDIFIKGRVIDKETKKPISNAIVSLYNIDLDRNRRVKSGSSGYFIQKLNYNNDYTVSARKSGYSLDRKNINTKREDFRKSDTIEVLLELDQFKVNQTFTLENIYYDLDKYTIRNDASQELNELAALLKDNPEIDIEMSSHTDCRADDKYNMTLSVNRAKAAVDYLINRGIDKSRLTFKGFGETQLVNDCDCSKGAAPQFNCTDEEHQKNRRTEFKVTNIR